ncbi:futalosine hydrolase [Mucilaginibacter sp.]|uniref:futalosine hydrolase n=1 Tax=Mucilaginibacter sp. TaxID=1882438 RepID=UPI0035BBBCEC
MRILFVAATEFEVESLVESKKLKVKSKKLGFDSSSLTTPHSLLITGVGMVATAYALGRELAKNQYDLAVNLGIAGTFDRNIALGDLVEITEDTIVELGAEDDETFLSISQMGFGKESFAATYSLTGLTATANIKPATAITVNTVHGNEASIQKVQQRLNVQIESMEGAAFFYACNEAGVPCMQIRAVSNYIEKRNREAWQIGFAIKNLNKFAVEIVESFEL